MVRGGSEFAAGRARALRLASLTLALVSALAVLVPAPASADRLSETRRALRAARSRLASLVADERELQGIINAMSSRLQRTRNSLASARARLSFLEATIRSHESRIAKLQASQRAKRRAIGARARQLYILGPGFQMEAFLAAKDFNEFMGRTTALEQLQRHDKIVIEDLATMRHRSAKLRDALLQQRKVVASVRDEIAEREAVQRELLGTKLEAEQRLENQIDSSRKEVEALEREQARIEALIRSRQSVSVGPVSRKGFVWPIRGRVTSPYGPRWGRMHTGIDIDCRTGDAIAASKGGRVIASEWGNGYGQMVIIDHGNGVSTLYAHLSRRSVSDGQSVDRRQRIGACGETGHAYGDHLHFEVRVNGRPVNPRNFLP